MASLLTEIIKGRKTFFIAPDKSLFPETYLEDYLALGYESYFINHDTKLPLSTKLEVILSVFTDSIIFINIDYPIQNDSWPAIIKRLLAKFPDAFIGVIYAKKQTLEEKDKLEKFYLFELGIKCGCIQLEYQKRNNFSKLEKTLFANQAMGRRKNVRALCTNSCMMKYRDEFDVLKACTLSDISLSHFTIEVGSEQPISFKDYEKISSIQFFIKGLYFNSDAVLFTTRDTGTSKVYVFAFEKSNGQVGLDPLNRQLLIPKLYQIMEHNCMDVLDKLFQTTTQRLKEKPTGSAANKQSDTQPQEEQSQHTKTDSEEQA
ncbi:MAG: hypothetical protein K6E69_09415 [Treponema sp.]|uniref:hypothetical protein n=1 Tax=Treponema sp. TaxID=166 RepID=UPI00298D6CCC|nr:hypothetical protein [Treponema sp.]MCR5387323.1 hypothetical protein [Treponema sp.]